MILCDSGPLIAAAASNDADHHACTEMFTGLRLAGRRLLVPQTVVAEVGYMLATWVRPRSRRSSSTRSLLKTSKSST